MTEYNLGNLESKDPKLKSTLDKSPLTKAFLDPTNDVDQWRDDITKEAIRLRQNTNPDFFNAASFVLELSIANMGLVNPDLPNQSEVISGATQVLILMGKELGTNLSEESILLLIFVKLKKIGYFKKYLNEREIIMAINWIKSCLLTGVGLKTATLNANNPNSKNDDSDPFKDFIEGLDLDDL